MMKELTRKEFHAQYVKLSELYRPHYLFVTGSEKDGVMHFGLAEDCRVLNGIQYFPTFEEACDAADKMVADKLANPPVVERYIPPELSKTEKTLGLITEGLGVLLILVMLVGILLTGLSAIGYDPLGWTTHQYLMITPTAAGGVIAMWWVTPKIYRHW